LFRAFYILSNLYKSPSAAIKKAGGRNVHKNFNTTERMEMETMEKKYGKERERDRYKIS